MPHLLEPVTIILLESGGVGTADGGTGREFICCEELSLVMLLCRPPTDPPNKRSKIRMLGIPYILITKSFSRLKNNSKLMIYNPTSNI